MKSFNQLDDLLIYSYLYACCFREGDFKYIRGCPGFYDDWYPIPTYDAELVDNYYDKFSPFRKSRDANFNPKKYDAKKTETAYLFNIKGLLHISLSLHTYI